ncbi:hypothetical protein J7U46_12900 [Pelomonas sp. V22]|uniref:hypothetical protein n=1 Tax=Pelomonas sp. V22 TaxID=2822139 RepID=UPI0024A9B201|nr:hypothetical protein [Pelomonas sp. V22]MDI4633949.1 hypothetical protein [Pelomonas sp. V22]
MSAAGYFDSPWPGEDGGPARLQSPHGTPGLALQPGERLAQTSRRTQLSTMTVLGAPGEVFLLTHSALRAHLGLPTTACVERIDPLSLRTLRRSPRLRGGPMWPGGLAVHRNGSLYVVYGRHAHRLDRDCQLMASCQLPVAEPYNSFVILDNGLIVTKNLSERTPARLSVLDEQLASAAPDVDLPEPSVARLSAVGNTVYVVCLRHLYRYHWDEASQQLRLDTGWQPDYLADSPNSHGWDLVIHGDQAWLMDNGRHRYLVRMTGAARSAGANRLIRVSLRDGALQALEVSGLPRGAITNPPLLDPRRRIVVAYDSANAVLRAWRYGEGLADLAPLWQHQPFGAASHMILYPDTGELVVNDHRGLRESVVVLAIETGAELGRVRTAGHMQGVVFPSSGFGRDFYWSSMDRLTRVHVQ